MYANYPTREAPPPPTLQQEKDVPRSSSPDPFDTSTVFGAGRYYSDVAESQNGYFNIPEDTPVSQVLQHPQESSLNCRPELQAAMGRPSISPEPSRILDPKFVAELEKHLGQKEACANTNTLPAESASQLNKQIIPVLKPPPQSLKVVNKTKTANGQAILPSAAPSGSGQPSTLQYRNPSTRNGSDLRSSVQSLCYPSSSPVWSSAGTAQTTTSTALNHEINSTVKQLKCLWLSDSGDARPLSASNAPLNRQSWQAESSGCIMNGQSRYTPFKS